MTGVQTCALPIYTDNPHAVRLFGDMDAVAVRAAIEVVARIPDERIRATVAEHGGSAALADKLLARKADLTRRLAAATTQPA